MLDKNINKYRPSGKIIFRRHNSICIFCMILLLLMCSWFQLQFSSVYNNITELYGIDKKYILLNVMTNGVLLCIIFIIVNSLWLSCMLFSFFSSLTAIVNYYTIQLHSSPLTIAELGNYKTAFHVLGGYDLKLKRILPLLAILFLECLLSCMIKGIEKKSAKSKRYILIRNIGLVVVSGLFFFCGYIMQGSWMPELKYWSWIIPYQKYGYMPCTIKIACSSMKSVNMPEGYYTGCVENIKIERPDLEQYETPDIILILNESFYDLSLITDLETDVPYLENISSMENIIKGYAVNPAGGTNPSEYELLTSNSMKLMPNKVPFNILDMSDANSIVSHLKKLGYYTIGAHCETSVNYNRGKAYSEMGFDKTYFKEDFSDRTYYGDRIYATDECLYENLLSWLETGNDSPRFVFLLTIQNHGGWEVNDQYMDMVQAKNDFGEYDEAVDEYLSCIRLSDMAFKKLTEQLKRIDRDTIVCMVGDHEPSFTNKIAGDLDLEKKELLCISVPFVIWANYEIEDKNCIDDKMISMNYLIPSILDIAQVKLSPYYKYMLDLKSEIPILTRFAGYYDKKGNVYTYDTVSEYTESVNQYLYLEYNNLQKADRKQNYFDPY